MKKSILYTVFTLMFLVSCGEKTEVEEPKKADPNWTKEQSYEMNRSFIQEEESEIEHFLMRHPDWKTTKTGSGLRYVIYKDEESDSAQVGMIAKIQFTISLLDGTVCYESGEDAVVPFKIDKSDVESGLNEGIKLMSVGDRAKLIIPSAIAFGLAGDLDKIPTSSTVIYDVKLVGLE